MGGERRGNRERGGRTGEGKEEQERRGIKREGREGEAHETSQRLNFVHVSPNPQQSV